MKTINILLFTSKEILDFISDIIATLKNSGYLCTYISEFNMYAISRPNDDDSLLTMQIFALSDVFTIDDKEGLQSIWSELEKYNGYISFDINDNLHSENLLECYNVMIAISNICERFSMYSELCISDLYTEKEFLKTMSKSSTGCLLIIILPFLYASILM